MIDRGNVLPLTRQASLLRLSRSSVYYLPRPVPPARLVIMRRIDRLHLEYPFAGTYEYPHLWRDPMEMPKEMSCKRVMPRQTTMLPGGGSFLRAR